MCRIQTTAQQDLDNRAIVKAVVARLLNLKIKGMTQTVV
jgi:hypothetical protein